MRRIHIFFLAALLVSTAVSTTAQVGGNGLLNDSLTPQEDAAAVKAMRERMARIRRTRPTVALVLSGGGAKGAAHAGVLRYLEEIGMPIDMITGTSMGGLMGGLYALGYNAGQIDSLLRQMDWNEMMTDKLPESHKSFRTRMAENRYLLSIPFDYGRELLEQNEDAARIISVPEGIINGYNVRNLITSKTVGYQDSLDFSALPIPFFCVASDLASMKEYNWTSGKIVDALRSTMSIPFYFYPVRIGDMVLTDGGTRNNFPVDIARAMGADYVIGVDLHVETTPDEVRGLPSFVSQLTDMPGISTYFENIKNVDVHIQPDLAGFNMMSFDPESISTLIANGYRSAEDHAGELADIKRALGRKAVPQLHARPATDIDQTPVLISEIHFEGLSEGEVAYFRDKLHLSVGNCYSGSEIEDELAYIYASGAFSDVTYTLLGSEEPYKLIFRCTRGAAHNINVGARFDTEELASVILNIGLNANRLNGSKYELNARLSNNPFLSLRYSYTPAKGYQIGTMVTTGYNDVNMLNFAEDGSQKPRMRCWYNSIRVFGSNTSWINFASAVGLELEDMPFLEVSGMAYSGKKRDWDRLAFSAFYNLDYDTTDDKYFPARGIRLTGRSRLLFAGSNSSGISLDPYITGSVGILGAVSFSERFCVLPSAHVNLSTSSDMYLRHKNFIGGDIPMRYTEFQVPFVGCNGVYAAKSCLVSADVKLRYKLGKKGYLGAAAGGYLSSDTLGYILTEQKALGFAIDYEHNTPIGPLKLNLHWSSRTRSVGFYISTGYSF